VKVLIDTNVIIRIVKRDDPLHDAASRTVNRLMQDGAALYIAPQVVFEFWVVATRPQDANGLGFDPKSALTVVSAALQAFTIVADSPDMVNRWLDLCAQYEVRGKRAHDARLVAWMLCHKLDRLLTFNTTDFTAFTEIHAVAPVVA
jgi:predicted nucleic acid-binding protein